MPSCCRVPCVRDHDMSDSVSDRAIAALLPLGCKPYRSTAVFSEVTVPPTLLRSHRTAPGIWALIRVLDGCLLYRVLDPCSERTLDPLSAPGVVEPGVPHEVAPLGAVRFQVEFYRMTTTADQNWTECAAARMGE